MNKNKIFVWMMILGFFVFGVLSANAQKMSGEIRKNWKIIVTDYTKTPEGYDFIVNSDGTFDKIETKNNGKVYTLTTENLKEHDLQEIGYLIQKMNLTETTSEFAKGKADINYPFWGFVIKIGDIEYVVEGEFFLDKKIRILTNEQKTVYEHLKFKLSKIGVVFPKQIVLKPTVLVNLQTNFSIPLSPAEQKMLFRFEYWKRGDVLQHKGWYMDESGKVYKYSYDLKKNPQNPNSYDFNFKMLPTLFVQAKPEELTKLRELLTKVERGKYTEKEVAYDKGTAEISAFLPDSETGKYREVRLASIGDIEGINDAPETEELIVFLKSIVPAD